MVSELWGNPGASVPFPSFFVFLLLIFHKFITMSTVSDESSFTPLAQMHNPFPQLIRPIKLTENNYLIWKQQVLAAVKSNGLEGFLTGAKKCPELVAIEGDADQTTEGPNAAHYKWIRDLADKVASLGFLVVVPDFFYGDPFSSEKHTIETWMVAHPPDKGCEDAKTVIAAMKSKGVSKVGAAGFCWGGLAAVRLAAFECTEAAVLLHPGAITEEQISEVKIPLAILGAEKDQIGPADLMLKLGQILAAKSEVDSFVKIYPGVDHGFTLRYNEDDEFARNSAQEAQLDMINWLAKYIN